MYSFTDLDDLLIDQCTIHGNKIIKVCLENNCDRLKLCKDCIKTHDIAHKEIGALELYVECKKKFRNQTVYVEQERINIIFEQIQQLKEQVNNMFVKLEKEIQSIISEILDIKEINYKVDKINNMDQDTFYYYIPLMKEYYQNESMFFDFQLKIFNQQEDLIQKACLYVENLKCQFESIHFDRILLTTRKVSQKFMDCNIEQAILIHDNVVTGLIKLYNDDIATCSRDKTIKIWQNYTLKQIIKDHCNWVEDLINLPKNKFASCSDDKTIRIFHQVNTYKGVQWLCCKVLTGHHSYVRRLAFNYHIGKIISCSSDSTVRVWGENNEIVFTGHENCVYSLATFNDFIVSGDEGGDLILWGISKKSQIKCERGHSGCVNALLIVKQNIYSSGDDKNIIIWSLDLTKRNTIELKRVEMECLSIFNDELLIGGDEEGFLNIISIKDRQCIMESPAHSDRIFKIEVIGGDIYTVGADHMLKLFKLQQL